MMITYEMSPQHLLFLILILLSVLRKIFYIPFLLIGQLDDRFEERRNERMREGFKTERDIRVRVEMRRNIRLYHVT